MSGHLFDGHWKIDGRTHAVAGALHDDAVVGAVDGASVTLGVRRASGTSFVWTVDGVRRRMFVAQGEDGFRFSFGGRTFTVTRAQGGGGAATAADAFDPFAVSPMTGVVTKVHVAAGDRVAKGAPLFAVEAMKMEYVVKAERDVVIAEVKVAAGGRVSINEPGVTFVDVAP